jgi:hypothetical protein
MQDTRPSTQDGPALLCEIGALIHGWDVSRPVADFIAQLNERCSGQLVAAAVDGHQPKKRRGKSMSRRTGQSGHIEKSGKWWVVRWWQDVPGQDKRAHKRERICPIAGPGSLSKSAQERRAKEIIAASGADTEAHFEQVVTQVGSVTFKEQAESWYPSLADRKRKPVAPSTLVAWKSCLRNWLYPMIGHLPLSEINNAALKRVVAAMSEAGLAAQTIINYTLVLKLVVASAVNTEGEQIYPRKWNHKFVDMPVVVKAEQNTPCFSPEIMSGLARWKRERERMLFILSGSAGLRIGEALGVEIDKHISPDFQTISIEQKVRKGKVERRLKTESARRKIDLHPAIATMLRQFAGERRSGFLFCSKKGEPLQASAVLIGHLYPALEQLGFINSYNGTHKGGRPRLPALQEHASSESHHMSRGAAKVLAGARRQGHGRSL